MLSWLFKFLCAALVVVIVVYVCKLLLDVVHIPEPAHTIVMLLIGVGVLIFVVRYIGAPPGGPIA